MATIAELARGSGIDAGDARVLLRAALGVDGAYLVAHGGDDVSAENEAKFRALAARRIAGEPIAYIVGEREFYGHLFKVTPAVLIPRPETELLVELALRRSPKRVLDLGTGSGCVAISIALASTGAQVTALDHSPPAIDIARENAAALNARNVGFQISNWYHAVRGERYDLIVSNPPYVAEWDAHLAQGDLRFEPVAALAARDGGFAAIQAIVSEACAHLVPGGWLLFEHGYDQAARSRELLTGAGFSDVQSWRDLAGIERVSGAGRP